MGLSAPRRLARGLAGLTLAVSWPGPLAGQSTVRSVYLFADLSPDDGQAEVRMEYVLALDGPTEVTFELLGFGEATAEGFWMGERDNGAPVFLREGSGSMRSARFTVTRPPESPEMRLTARYLVRVAVDRLSERKLRVRVPVLSVGLPPEQGAPGLFRAELRLPEGWRVSDGFPSGLRARPDGGYGVDLAVVPAVVSLRAREDGAWRPGLPLLLDVLGALVIVGFAAFGWRHLHGLAAT